MYIRSLHKLLHRS